MTETNIAAMKEILLRIAYPRRDSEDSRKDIAEFAEEIQEKFHQSELDDSYDPTPGSFRSRVSYVDPAFHFKTILRELQHQRKTMNLQVENELARRALRGLRTSTILVISSELKKIGYRLNRRMDCRSQAKWMTGVAAGESYPCVTTGISEIDTGLSFAHENSRKDENFRTLQKLRYEGTLFAVIRGKILDI